MIEIAAVYEEIWDEMMEDSRMANHYHTSTPLFQPSGLLPYRSKDAFSTCTPPMSISPTEQLPHL